MILLSDAIVNRIEYFMRNKNIKSLWELYKLTGVPKTTINSLMNRTTEYPNLCTLQQICDGLEITLREFFNDISFDETYYNDNDD
jgi:DNA-binding Xre family transcriptional regulator